MVNQIQKRRDNARIHWPGVGFLLAFPPSLLSYSPLFPSLIHSYPLSPSVSLSLPLPSFSPSSSPPPFFLCFIFTRCSRGTEIGLCFSSLQALSSAFNFGGGSSRLRCHGDCTVWRRRPPQLGSPEQCRAECRFLALFRALFPSNGASGLKWALHLDTTTIPTPSLSPSPAFPSSLHVFDLLKIKGTKSQRKVGFCCVCHRTKWGSSNTVVEPRSDNADPGLVVTTGQTGQLYTRGRKLLPGPARGSQPLHLKLAVARSFWRPEVHPVGLQVQHG